ncbi:MAG: beta-propeller fold lactonase family protein [Candidatus Hydrogenedentes bacterium]|nr:beta-propeller fold lactonase family protein [Candidatus Hydrogenedentota bacterium]
MRYRILCNAMTCVFVVWAGLISVPAVGEGIYLSPLALAVQGDTVYVAEFTAKQIAVFDSATNEVKKIIALPVQPSGLALSPNGEQLFVTGGGPEGQVYVVRLSDGEVVATHAVGHTPKAPVVTPDGKTLFVCDQFNDRVTALDLTGSGERVTIPVSREPVAAAITPDGSRLFVANLLPASRADGNYVSAVVDVIDVTTKKTTGAIKLVNGSSSVLDICVSPDGKYAYVTHILSRYQLPTTQLERGWINTNAVSVIDVAGMSLVNTVLLDDVDLGAANPWGVTCTPDGKWLCVAHSGTHEISVIDRTQLHKKLADEAAAGEGDRVPNDLSFLVELRQRIKLQGKGPRGLAAIGSRVFAAEYFSGTLGVVDLAQGNKPKSQSFALGDEPAMSVARAGELFFHDGSVCFQQWQSCASCHPGDARVDALNWDILNDGMGNPKNTKNLLLSYETPPTTATGIRANAVVSTRAGIRHILFNQLPEEYALSVDEYLKALKPVPSPKLEQGELSPSAERGEAIFEMAKCSRCHSGPLFTDMKGHVVGTGTRREVDTDFDTPTLIEVWRTAPYLHDGRAMTLEEVLTTFNNNDAHGKTSALSEKQVKDLVEYVLSL